MRSRCCSGEGEQHDAFMPSGGGADGGIQSFGGAATDPSKVDMYLVQTSP